VKNTVLQAPTGVRYPAWFAYLGGRNCSTRTFALCLGCELKRIGSDRGWGWTTKGGGVGKEESHSGELSPTRFQTVWKIESAANTSKRYREWICKTR